MAKKPTNEELEQRIRELERTEFERKEAEEALRKRERYINSIFRSAPVGIGLVVDRILEKVNKRLCEITGYDEEELVGHSARILYPDDEEFERVGREKYARIAEHGTGEVETRWKRKDGAIIDILLSSTALELDDWSRGVTFTSLDISDHKRAEERLRSTLAELSVIHEHAPIAMMLVDRDRRVRKVNGFAAKFSDRHAEEMIGMRGGEALRCLHHLDDPQGCGFGPACAECHVRKAVLDTFETGVSHNEIEEWLPFPRGESTEKRCLLISTAFLKIDGSERVLVCVQDITERKQAEVALRESEEFTRVVMNHLPIGVAVNSVDPKVEFSYMNDNFPKIYRTTREALAASDSFWDVVYEDSDYRQEIRNRVMEDCASGDPDRMYWEDIPFTRKGEGPFFICARNIPLKSKQLMISTVWDVTERKRAEEALRESRDLLDATQRLAKVGGWVWDVENQTMSWTEQTYCIHGFDPGEFVASSAEHIERSLSCYDPDDRPIIEAAFQSCAEEGKPYNLEFPLTTADGRRRWIQTMAQPVLDGERVVRVIGNIVDITERKRAEEALKESEQRLQAILESNANPIVVYDAEGFPQYLNPAFTEVFGWTLDELIGQRIPFVPEDHKETTAAKIKEIYSSGAPVKFVSQRLTKKGNTLDVIVSAAIIRGGEDDGTGMVVNLTDITEQKNLEQQLRQAQKMESVGRLAGGVAHDFNNMLSVILGYTEIALERVDPTQPFYNSFREIQKAAERSSNLTRQLLAFGRKQTIAPKVLDLNETVEGMLKMLRRLIGEDIDLAWLPEAKIWPVRMDSTQIDQILANLCVNARDAIADVGKIAIETGTTTFDKAYCAKHPGFTPGDFVLLAVSDDGCGMDRQTLKNLFEPFFTTKEADKGTGLGLATVYGIVKQNKGFINVYSEPGQGTTVKIYLPRQEIDPEWMRKKAPLAADAQGNKTILLVEDEPAILEVTQTMLERLGYTVLAAGTPGEAIELAREFPGEIHLLMTDVVMPEMNGRDLAKNLLSLYPNLNRLFMSGYTANVIAHHGILDEGVQFIQKPFSKQDLSIKVREVLDKMH